MPHASCRQQPLGQYLRNSQHLLLLQSAPHDLETHPRALVHGGVVARPHAAVLGGGAEGDEGGVRDVEGGDAGDGQDGGGVVEEVDDRCVAWGV